MNDSILDQVIQHPEVIYTLAKELVAEREQLEGIRKQTGCGTAQGRLLRHLCKFGGLHLHPEFL